MNRRGKHRTSDSALTESLLTTQSASDEIEMANMGDGSNRLRSRRRTDGRASPTNAEPPVVEETFVIHVLEPHHTLAGIALQYSVSVDQLMRINKLFHQNDVHALSQLKIPANKHGALYADPEAFRSNDPDGTATHTTARPRAAVASEVAVDGKFEVETSERERSPSANESIHESEAVLQDTEAFLDTFDSQMQTAIQAMDSVLEKQMNEGGDTGVIMPIFDTSQESSGLMAFYPSDWRVVVCVVMTGIVITIPIVLYFFKYMYVNIRSPEPYQNN